ncbi:hypothetical protein DFJ73DRAFT_149127 [Zopfochytrium polystomum]|nr:hypothetical protein DFJ73DRAFT_149127 [Zopfochytrium polystomum]
MMAGRSTRRGATSLLLVVVVVVTVVGVAAAAMSGSSLQSQGAGWYRGRQAQPHINTLDRCSRPLRLPRVLHSSGSATISLCPSTDSGYCMALPQ